MLIRLKEQQPAPDKARIFRLADRGGRRGIRPVLLPDRPLVPDDPDDPGGHRHPVGDVPLVGAGILLMLTLAFRSPVLAAAGDPADAARRSRWCWA